MGRSAIDMAGKVFGKLTVVRRVFRENTHAAWWLVVDEQGKSKIVSGSALRNGWIKGYLNCSGVSHGHARRNRMTRTYSSWYAMLQRCQNKKDKAWSYYGGRGLTVCSRWLKFENFLEDMGEKPVGLTLERKNNSCGYSPMNCKWATWKTNLRNRRSWKWKRRI